MAIVLVSGCGQDTGGHYSRRQAPPLAEMLPPIGLVGIVLMGAVADLRHPDVPATVGSSAWSNETDGYGTLDLGAHAQTNAVGVFPGALPERPAQKPGHHHDLKVSGEGTDAWEYRVVSPAADKLEVELNHLRDEGWKLFSERKGPGKTSYIFRRIRVPEPTPFREELGDPP